MSHARTVAPQAAPAPLPRAFTEFSSWPDEAFVQVKVVALLFDCSRCTVWRRVKQGLIPAPVKIAGNCVVWQVGGLREALSSAGGDSQ